jgi:hypothetical protein
MIPCVASAETGCPCGLITQAGSDCLNEIIDRNSPAAACLGKRVAGETSQEAYYAQLEAVATALCGVKPD